MSAGELLGIDGDFLGLFGFARDFDRRCCGLLGLDGRLGFDAERIVDVGRLKFARFFDGGRGLHGLRDFDGFDFNWFNFHRLDDV